MPQNGFSSPFDDMTESEKAVAEFLAANGMWWNYEQPVFVRDEKGRPRVWSPDFYVPRLGIYVEVVGNNEANYSYREEIYRLNHIPIIFIYPNQDGWHSYLLNQIAAIHEDRSQLVNQFRSP